MSDRDATSAPDHNGRHAARDETPVGFSLATPGDWFDLDLDPATRNQRIAALVDRRIATSPQIAPRRQDMLRVLRRAARDADERGITFASMMVEEVDGMVISASLNVAIAALSSVIGENPPGVGAEVIRDALAGIEGDGSRLVTCVDLPAGTAVRVRELHRTPLPERSESMVTSVVQYMLPVPASSALAVITFSTPAVALADSLAGLFGAIAESFAFRWEPV